MTRSNRRWSASMVWILVLPLFTQCQKQVEVRHDTVHVRPYGTPSAEADDEKAGQRPATLGGPFGGGVASSYTMRDTPLATVALDENMQDADLVNYLNKLRYDMNVENGQLILASCTRTGKDCGSDQAAIYVQPEIGANTLDMNTVTENGVVVARLINYDQEGRKTKAFLVPGNTRAWWVVRLKNKQLESLFLVRDFTADPTHPTVKLLRKATFTACPGHQADKTRAAMTRWWDCNHEKSATPGVGMRPVTNGSYFRFVSNGPPLPQPSGNGDTSLREASIWITCSLGCCIAQ